RRRGAGDSGTRARRRLTRTSKWARAAQRPGPGPARNHCPERPVTRTWRRESCDVRAWTKEPEMATTAVTTRTGPAAVRPTSGSGLRREIGFIGLLWASGGSIIGSGWLFGAQGALATAGPAAVISWGIGAIAIFLLALTHAELGGMYPVAGGTARFPHYAFGGAVGASFGWFSWLQAATVAPIEVSAMLTYAQEWDFAKGWVNPDNGVLSTTGIIVSILLMAL